MTDEREYTDGEIVDTIEFLRKVVRIKTKDLAHYDGENAHRAADMLQRLHLHHRLTRYDGGYGGAIAVAGARG